MRPNEFDLVPFPNISNLDARCIACVHLISTLRAQYERIDGTNDAAELMGLNFRNRWCTTPMAATNGMDILWKYEVPKWLFPPPIR